MRRLSSQVRPPPLSSIARVELLQSESPKSIKKAWLRHHQKHDSIASVLESSSFARLQQRTREAPLFVFPIPNADKTGYRSVFFQGGDRVHLYTELEAYKLRGAAASAALSCVFFDELEEAKGLVLMRGAVDTAVLRPTDAAFLANQTTIWYHDDARFEVVRQFNLRPAEFSFDRVVEKMQSL
jgi:hypothetical protein